MPTTARTSARGISVDPELGRRQLRQPSARRRDEPNLRLRPRSGVRHDHRPQHSCPTASTGRAGYADKYLFADYSSGQTCSSLIYNAPRAAPVAFATQLGSEESWSTWSLGAFRSRQALYYTSYAGGGQAPRISYAAPERS